MVQEDQIQSIVRTLLSKGLITRNQITKALEYQCRLPPGQYLPLTRILTDFEFITEEQLKFYLGEDYAEAEDPIGRILVEQGIVSYEQMEQALQILNSFPRSHVSDVLIDMGFASRNEIHQAISRYQLQQSKHLQRETEESTLSGKPLHSETSTETSPEIEQEEAAPAAEPQSSAQKKQEHHVQQAMVHLPLGRKLIAQGYLSEEELQDALEYQQRLPKVIYKPIGEILVALGYITPVQLKEVLEDQPPRPKSRMGELLLKAGVVEEWQLSHALSLQFSSQHGHKKLGTLLVELGYASRAEIERELKRHYGPGTPGSLAAEPETASSGQIPPASQQHKPLGQVLLEKGFVTEAQLSEALAQQSQLASEYKPLGDILVLLGHLTEANLQEALRAQGSFSREPLGQILLKQSVIEEWQLSHALCVQFEQAPEQRLNLGALLVQLGYAQQGQIEEALLNYYRQRRQSPPFH